MTNLIMAIKSIEFQTTGGNNLKLYENCYDNTVNK